jgi:S-DNA-T family DNA segregation ATPase FtsK/SpoIIIE
VTDPQAVFTLIDLKGGLEFQLFQDLPRINVLPDLRSASIELGKFSSTVKARMALLRSLKFKDRDSYLADCKTKRKKPDAVIKSRIIIVIDEAAEMFLAGNQSPARDIQKAREIISQIARQGRAVGVHLIIATQRPDSRSLDPQVKANLTGVLCFQMANDASSMVVIGCGRATDLPPISGRAIWKSGSQMTEVQVPYMAAERAEELLAAWRQPPQLPKTLPDEHNGSLEHAEQIQNISESR